MYGNTVPPTVEVNGPGFDDILKCCRYMIWRGQPILIYVLGNRGLCSDVNAWTTIYSSAFIAIGNIGAVTIL